MQISGKLFNILKKYNWRTGNNAPDLSAFEEEIQGVIAGIQDGIDDNNPVVLFWLGTCLLYSQPQRAEEALVVLSSISNVENAKIELLGAIEGIRNPDGSIIRGWVRNEIVHSEILINKGIALALCAEQATNGDEKFKQLSEAYKCIELAVGYINQDLQGREKGSSVYINERADMTKYARRKQMDMLLKQTQTCEDDKNIIKGIGLANKNLQEGLYSLAEGEETNFKLPDRRKYNLDALYAFVDGCLKIIEIGKIAEVIDIAIPRALQALELINIIEDPKGRSDIAEDTGRHPLDMLGDLYDAKYGVTGDKEDLQKAASYYEQALAKYTAASFAIPCIQSRLRVCNGTACGSDRGAAIA